MVEIESQAVRMNVLRVLICVCWPVNERVCTCITVAQGRRDPLVRHQDSSKQPPDGEILSLTTSSETREEEYTSSDLSADVSYTPSDDTENYLPVVRVRGVSHTPSGGPKLAQIPGKTDNGFIRDDITADLQTSYVL